MIEKTKFLITREYNVEIPLNLGDEVTFHKLGQGNVNGKITHIFDEGREFIVNDKYVIHSGYLRAINGINLKHIEGKMTVI